jgi:hypothetical protein
MSSGRYPIKVTVTYLVEQWDWCCANLKTGTWNAMFGVTWDNRMSYYFDNPEDATAFSIKFQDAL